MKKNIIKLCFIILISIAMTLIPGQSVKAAETILPTANNNLKVSLRSKSELVATSNGYMRVFYDGSKICIEYYDNDFSIKSKKTIAMELEAWGGFFAGQNAYYIVEGKSNTDEKNDEEVIRVIKYDINWNKLGTAKITSNSSLFGGEVRYPFDYGCVEMTETNGKLYIVTGHEGYVDEAVGQGHQGFLMIEVDEKTMTGKIVKCDLWHSFAQYIQNKDSYLYVLEQSEGSRYTKLSRYNKQNLNKESIPVLEYGGSRDSVWAIACYASVDDMALSSKNILCLGTSIDQSKFDDVSEKTAHNIYLTVTPINNFTKEATQTKWLTAYNGNGKSFLGTKITKVNDNRFMISWEEYDTSRTPNINDTLSGSILHYIFVDGSGNKISKEYTAAAPISDCHPILKDSKIIYYASNENMVNFYTIDANSGSFTKKSYRVAGDNSTWQLKDGTLTISGKGTISVDSEAKHRGPISSTARSYSYSTSDNAWSPIREKVEKIVINKGITSISDNAFCYFSNLKEVEIQEGVKSIGKQAFYYCNSLNKIKIPNSVTSIGEDFLWTGYYWVASEEHVVRATIYAQENSYAIKYAIQNKINYKITDISKAEVSKIENQVYTGEEIKPEIEIKSGTEILKKDIDYETTYTNNIETGKATITITGKGEYSGTKTVTFNIIPDKVKNIKVKKYKQNEITLEWSKNNGNITKYKIYKLNTKTNKYEYVGKTSNTSFKVKQLTPGTTYKFKVRAYKTIDNKQCFGAYSAKLKTSTLPATTKIKTITTKNKKVTLKWNKVAGANGYTIYMSTNKNNGYSKIKNITKGNTLSYRTAKLEKNKTYYFKIRSYKTVEGKKIYSSYSNIIKIKVK